MADNMNYVDLEKQETHISYMRDEDFAYLYTTDRTTMTKMDKRVKNSPELFSIDKQNDISKTYKFPKRLVSIRGKIREMSDEQRQAAAERLKENREKG